MSDDYKPVLRAGSDPLVFFKYPGADEGKGSARGHIMATVIARALRDEEQARRRIGQPIRQSKD